MPPVTDHVIRIRGARGRARARLVCFPHAGGNPDGFRRWAEGVDPTVEVLSLRLPGHGPRLRERPHSEWAALVDDAHSILREDLALPHFLFGHSFGGRLAYELAHRLGADHPGSTRRLFVFGCRSPDWPQARPRMHEQADEDFLDVLRKIGGMPEKLLDNPGMMRMLLPAIRSEIRLAEIWDDRHGRGVDVPITAVYGRYDPIDGAEAMTGWRRYGARSSEILGIPGGHFLTDEHSGALIDLVNARMSDAR
jgi:surfactin synthase thioesterase subunit